MVVYIVSSQLVEAASRLPSNKNRSKIVHSLVNSLGLLKTAQVVRPVPATVRELREYHSDDYLDVVLDDNALPSTLHGLTDDCPVFPGLSSYVQLVAGATPNCSQGPAITDVAICWDGGRHHAQKSAASGFCYVADCVLAILAMRRVQRDSLPSSPYHVH